MDDFLLFFSVSLFNRTDKLIYVQKTGITCEWNTKQFQRNFLRKFFGLI